jgi:hypothetical protein
MKLLRKVFDRIKRATAKNPINLSENKMQNGLENMKFFKRLIMKEAENNQKIREDIERRKNNNGLL